MRARTRVLAARAGPAARRAPPGARAGARRDAQQQRAVGLQRAGREAVDLAHLLDAEPARGALVGERGVDVAVEQHDRALGEQRQQALLDELRARGGVEQRLGARRDAQRRVLDERADPLGDLDTAGLAQQLDAQAARAQRLARARASVDLPAPSRPSIVISLPRATPRKVTRAHVARPAHGERAGGDLRWSPCTQTQTRRQRIDAHPHARAVLAPALRGRAGASHAYLFHGPPGTGKRAVARAFAAALLADGAQRRRERARADRARRASGPDVGARRRARRKCSSRTSRSRSSRPRRARRSSRRGACS